MQILEQSANSLIIALSETEISKVLLPITLVCTDILTGEPIDFLDGGLTLESEITALQYANNINDLMPNTEGAILKPPFSLYLENPSSLFPIFGSVSHTLAPVGRSAGGHHWH